MTIHNYKVRPSQAMPSEAIPSEAVPPQARPFLKWAGGKGRLIGQLVALLPPGLSQGRLQRYVEPFIGSGALFFHLAQAYPLESLHISDINPQLILVYQAVRDDLPKLIDRLSALQDRYLAFSEQERREFYYDLRAQFNQARFTLERHPPGSDRTYRAAQLIFLNRTCYNGLFRQNSQGAFNVPFGRYKNPRICDETNLRQVARLLQRATIHSASFTACESVVDECTFVYFDPPYRPLSKTSNFTSYSRMAFDDGAQRQLAALFRLLDARGASLMLSNSDPHNVNPQDDFFEELYAGFNIRRVKAARLINSHPGRRGPVSELVITNY